MDDAKQKEIEDFCKERELEKRLRDVIDGITAKLNRTNLSADDGKRYAERLGKAYEKLKYCE